MSILMRQVLYFMAPTWSNLRPISSKSELFEHFTPVQSALTFHKLSWTWKQSIVWIYRNWLFCWAIFKMFTLLAFGPIKNPPFQGEVQDFGFLPKIFLFLMKFLSRKTTWDKIRLLVVPSSLLAWTIRIYFRYISYEYIRDFPISCRNGGNLRK